MATAIQQRRWRARDPKQLIQVRLSHEALARLTRLATKTGARGMGDVLERLLLAEGRGEPPEWMLHAALRLGREFLRLTDGEEAALRDGDWLYTIRRVRL